LCGEVSEEQDGTESLGKIFNTNGEQFLECFGSEEIVTRGFLWVKTVDGCLIFSTREAGDRQFKLIGGLEKLKKGFIRCGVTTGGMRLKDRG
jgi:hypothetical protein